VGNNRESLIRISSKGSGDINIVKPNSFIDHRKLKEIKSRLQVSPYLRKP
jgi:hypothetical protein